MKTEPNFQDADGFYEKLLDAHHGLSRAQSESLNARLVLVMAHAIGNSEQLAKCLEAAADGQVDDFFGKAGELGPDGGG